MLPTLKRDICSELINIVLKLKKIFTFKHSWEASGDITSIIRKAFPTYNSLKITTKQIKLCEATSSVNI